jgi:hypothetical protein
MIKNHPSYDNTGGDTTVMAVKMRIGRLTDEAAALSKDVGRTRTDSERERLAECRVELQQAKAKLAKLLY